MGELSIMGALRRIWCGIRGHKWTAEPRLFLGSKAYRICWRCMEPAGEHEAGRTDGDV